MNADSNVLTQAGRLYPPQVERFLGEPLRKDFAIRRVDDLRGEGVFALRDFAVGDTVFAFTGTILPTITQFTLQVDETHHIHDPYVMGKVLHHCAPNCHVDVCERRFIAIRPIAAGDLVTMDYCQTESVLFRSFSCGCGAPQCRGYVSGFSGMAK